MRIQIVQWMWWLNYFYVPFLFSILKDPCMAPLGMQDGRITDSRLTASSEYNHQYRASSARLQSKSWIAKTNNKLQWIKVDLETSTRVKGISIQGRYDANQYVTSFTLSFSNNGLRFYPYREGRTPKVLFCANYEEGQSVEKFNSHFFYLLWMCLLIRLILLSIILRCYVFVRPRIEPSLPHDTCRLARYREVEEIV